MEAGVLLALALLSFVLPVFRLPAPSGPFAAGTAILSRQVQVWYPAPAVPGPPAPYQPALGGVRHWIFRRVQTGAVANAPLVPEGGPFPVLVYVHGWGGARWENTALLQDLASHGFIVAASDQPDDADPMDFGSPAAYARTMQVIPAKLDAQVRSASQVLDQLTALNAPGERWAGRMDAARAGILGFSFGGATAAEAALADHRFKASLNMDGLTFGRAAAEGPRFPYLEMSDDTPLPTAAELQSPAAGLWPAVLDANARHTQANFARNGGFYLTLPGSLHPNFSDYPMLVPVRRLNGAGPADPWRTGATIRSWVVGFFTAALQGGDWPKPSPDIRLETWPPP